VVVNLFIFTLPFIPSSPRRRLYEPEAIKGGGFKRMPFIPALLNRAPSGKFNRARSEERGILA
jgi:hypothetical protein